MADKRTIEIWVTMDEDGDYAVAKSGDDIDGNGDDDGLKAVRRVVCINAAMAPPVHQVVSCTIPDHKDGAMEVVEVIEA